MVPLARISVLTVAFAVACGSDPATSHDPGSPGSAGNGSRFVESIPPLGSGKLPPVLYASFVAEMAAGEGPGMLSFQNDTEFLMSLWLGQAEFIAIPSGLQVGPELAVSAATETDTTTGKHKSDGACVKFPIKKFVGPSTLEPGSSYSMSIAFDEALGFVGTLSVASSVPFVALRAKVFDATSDDFNPSRLRLELLNLEGERGAKSPLFTTYDENRTNYAYAGRGEFTAVITFSAGSGQRYSATDPVQLAGAPGYTVVVDDEPVADASAVVELDEVAP